MLLDLEEVLAYQTDQLRGRIDDLECVLEGQGDLKCAHGKELENTYGRGSVGKTHARIGADENCAYLLLLTTGGENTVALNGVGSDCCCCVVFREMQAALHYSVSPRTLGRYSICQRPQTYILTEQHRRHCMVEYPIGGQVHRIECPTRLGA